MPCYRPIKAWRSATRNENGKRPVVFSMRDALILEPIDLPCGQCIGCRLERSRQWAIRMVHEASLHERNCFITLTFRDECLPPNGSLDKGIFQKFMKRLRKRFGEQRIRFFHCGEYGERFGRPHYHAILFGFDFSDKRVWRRTRDGHEVYRSEVLEEIWPFGQSEIGDVTFESAAYVARYITKKITGERAVEYYRGRLPEYTTMSRRPGIGKEWYDRFSSDVFPSDEVVIRGKVMRPPKFYERQFELAYPSDFAKVKFKRKSQAITLAAAEPWYRLAVREECQNLKFRQLKRGFENG